MLERLLNFEKPSQCPGCFPRSAFPLFKLRILTLYPGKILLPLAHVSEQMRQIPFVSLGNVSASWNSRRHSEKDESGNQETKKRVNNSPLEIRGFLASRLIQ